MGAPVLYDVHGEPLLWILDPEPPYRRNQMGFQPPVARESKDVVAIGSTGQFEPDEETCDCQCDCEAEGIVIPGSYYDEEES